MARCRRRLPDLGPLVSESPPEPTWLGIAWFGPWWLVYAGPVGPTAPHAHHALQAVLGEAVVIEGDCGRRRAPTIIVAGERHRLLGRAGEAALVYVDGDVVRTRGGTPLDDWYDRGIPATWSEAADFAAAVAGPLAVVPGAEPPMVRAARQALADPDDARSIAQIAADIGVSASRLAHLFTASVGIPMRSYRRWQRLLVAAEAIAGGAGLTAAAHQAGFADGPHLARTFRRHFGLSVRELTRAVHWASRP
jgi:AraC-like DNA-binding protein